MTYTLTLTPYLAAQLAACCLHAGLDVRNIFPAYLTRHTATAATAAAAEEPAGHTTPVAEPPTQPRPAAPVAEERTRLIRPGMTIPAGDVDPEDESLYI